MKLITTLVMIFLVQTVSASNCGYAPLVTIGSMTGNLKGIKDSCGRYPSSLEELVEDTEFAICAKRSVDISPLDAWGNQYIYKYNEDMILPLVKTKGADGMAGTNDDLSNYLEDGSLRTSYFEPCNKSVVYILTAIGVAFVTLLVGTSLYFYRRKNA